MDAILLAGGKSSPTDPLSQYTGEKYKALIDINGKPMLQWALDAIQGSAIEHVFVMGLPEEIPLPLSPTITRLPDHGSIVANIRAGAAEILKRRGNPHEKVMTISADVPGITPEILNWCMNEFHQGEHDIYYTVVAQDVMEKRYPQSKRSYVRFKDITVCGGDVNAMRVGKAVENLPIFEALSSERKNALKQAALIGFDILFLLLIRQLSLKEAEKRICQRLKLTGRVVVSPYAEIAMDVDKPFQLDIMRKDLVNR